MPDSTVLAQRLYKKEKLCSATAISSLFSRDASNFSTSAFPIRAFWRVNQGRRSDAPVQFLISVPKKRLRHAVDRVLMRRRIREAYRLSKQHYPLPLGVKVDVVLLYVDSKLQPYEKIHKAVNRLLDVLSRHDYSAPADENH